MRLLRINGENVDIDEKTAIGINLQTYDIKEPGKRKINISNSFSIPTTSRNNKIIGFSGNPQFIEDTVYSAMTCDYWIDNEKIISDAKVRIDEVEDRIKLFIYQKPDIWDTLKGITWSEFVPDFLSWLQSEKSYPSSSSPTLDTFQNFISTYKATTEGLHFSMAFGNLYEKKFQEFGENKEFNYDSSHFVLTINPVDYGYKFTAFDDQNSSNVTSIISMYVNGIAKSFPFDVLPGAQLVLTIQKTSTTEAATLSLYGEDLYLEDQYRLWAKYWPSTQSQAWDGGHLMVYIKSIFEYFQDTYDVDFLVGKTPGAYAGNIWDDSYACAVYVPIREIDILMHYTGGGVLDGYYFGATTGIFEPHTDIEDKPEKTLYDLVTVFFQHFNIIKDDIFINGLPAIKLARFDDIKTDSEVVKWSGKLSGTPKFKPYITGIAQKNYIKFSSIYEDGNPKTNARTLYCLNENLDIETDLFEIDAYIPAFIDIDGGVAPNLGVSDAFKTFTLMIDSGVTTSLLRVYISDGGSDEENYYGTLPKAALYSLENEYGVWEDIIEKPKFYEIEKWLSLNDIKELEFFKQYYIQELNASFFINKIKGFNPDKSYAPTKLEILKISDTAVVDSIDLEWWTDGFEIEFTDGLGDEYY